MVEWQHGLALTLDPGSQPGGASTDGGVWRLWAAVLKTAVLDVTALLV
jgi:hypothetical protein